MPEVQALQRSAEWFDARKKRITGSMVGAILGINPYMTPEDALRTMVREAHGAEREFTGNVATEWGTYNEDGATWDFFLDTNREVTECGFFTYEEWLGASPDGLVDDDAVVEIKCPYGIRNDNPPVFKRLKEELPHYYAQTQIEMLCTGRSKCYFYQWTPHGTALEIIDRDEDWLEENINALKAFYLIFLNELDNPIHLEDKRPRLTKKAAVLLVEEIDDLNEAIERATERKKDAMKELVEMAGNRNVDIDGRLLTKFSKKGSVSYAKIVKKLRPQGFRDSYLDKFRGKPSESWRLT